MTLLKNIFELKNYFERKRQFQIIFLFFLMIFGAVLEMISLGLIVPFLMVLTNPEKLFSLNYINEFKNFLSINNAKDFLFPLTFLFIIAIVMSSIGRLLLLTMTTRISFSLGADIGSNIFKAIIYQPYENHLYENSSNIISGIINKVNNVIYNVVLSSLTIVSSLILLFSIVITLMIIQFEITIFSLIVFLIIYGVVIFFSKRPLKKYSKKISNLQNTLVKTIQEGLGSIRDIIINRYQKNYIGIFQNADKSLRKVQGNVHIIGGSPKFIIEGLGMIALVIMSYYLSKFSENFLNYLPVLGALALGAQRTLPLLQQIFGGWTSIKATENSLSDVLMYLKKNNKPLPLNNDKFISFKKVLKFKDVSFSYSDQKIKVLNKINFEIRKGYTYGVIGETGSGKSTLVDLIMGLLVPTEGSVFVDDKNISSKTENLQQLISHVPQNIFLTDNSILKNIVFNKTVRNSDLLIKNSIKIAELEDFIINLPLGLQSNVGENGVQLSGGQKQRIGIARALVKKFEILILDEATSGLDIETEDKIIKNITSFFKGKTLIIITHRHSILKYCDKIIEVKNKSLSNKLISFK